MAGSEYLIKELRRVREAFGLTQEAWGQRIKFSAQHVSSIERGTRAAHPRYLESVDRAFGTAFLDFYREFIVGEAAPVWLRPFIEYEARASLVRTFQTIVIPGLLQTEAYARAVLLGHGHRGESMEAALLTRLHRQDILQREPDPCQFVAVLDESVLRRRIGSPDLMRDQLKAIVTACDSPTVAVQVVPADVGAYPGLDGPFTLASVDGRPIGYLEGHLKGRVIENPDATSDLEGIWESIRGYALPVQQSLDLIVRTAEEWT
ncbi:helix-turn-helix domain-containing protein [Plantactinospora sp. WMMB334]|uniref:helix-turn-helix domain-containing protein n=1 Tax=Plantactinospora sp. WMMB334 TaxID=3404119 RepID=UPI003B96384A